MQGALKIIVLKNGAELQTLDFEGADKSSISVGRSQDADVRLDDRSVGRNHAVIQLASGGGYLLQKKTEYGKLQVNGADVTQLAMKSGDVISIADFQLRLESRAPEPEQSVSVESVIEAETHPPMISTGEIKVSTQSGAVNSDVTKSINVGTSATPAMGTGLSLSELSAPQKTATSTRASHAGLKLDIAEPPLQPSELIEAQALPTIGENEKTSMLSSAQLSVKLILQSGEANTKEFEIKSAEVSIGRGSSCDIVVEDKKSSRKHCIIKRIGGGFLLQDLESANGTYVNGIKVNEQELSGEDVIRIGATEFIFKATNEEYFAQEHQGVFLTPPADSSTVESLPPLETPSNIALADEALPTIQEQIAMAPQFSTAPTYGDAMGIPGVTQTGGSSSEKKSLMQRYRDLPKAKRMRFLLIGGVILSLIALVQLEEEDQQEAAKLKAKQAISIDPKNKEFGKLPREKREFIDQTYGLALDYFTRMKYEQAIFEASKILEILPSGYKDILDIKAYAQQGIETLKAQAEEADKKKKEQERKENIAKLVAQAQEFLKKGLEADAKEVFSRILELDPDNPTVAQLKAAIEEREQKLRMEEDQRRQIEMMKEAMRAVITVGKDLMSKGAYYQAMDKFAEVPTAGADADLLKEARDLIEIAQKELIEKRQPHLDSASAAYDAKDYEKSRAEYLAGLEIDPRCAECDLGILRIRRDVHERAQKIYIEAIIAESVSDLVTAKKKYIECYKASVPEDDYYGRCWRKYQRFTNMDQESDAEADGMRAPAEALFEDPFTKEVLDFL